MVCMHCAKGGLPGHGCALKNNWKLGQAEALSASESRLEHVGDVVLADEGVVHGDDLDVWPRQRRPQHEPPDAAKACRLALCYLLALCCFISVMLLLALWFFTE